MDTLAPVQKAELPSVRLRAQAMVTIIARAVDETPPSFQQRLAKEIVKTLR